MNKKTKIGLAIVAAVAIGLGVSAYNMKAGDQIVAMVNEKPVYESEIEKRFVELSEANNMGSADLDFNKLEPEMKKNIIKSIIISGIIAEKADADKIVDSSQFKKMMEAQAFQIKQRVFLEQLAEKDITEAKIKQKYEEFAKIEGNKQEIRATQILFQDEKTANEVKSKIVSIEQFDEFVNKNQGEKKHNGDLGYFTKDQMPPAFSETVFASEPGKVVGPIKTEFGWHIVKIVDKRNVKVPSFNEIKAKIKSEMFIAFINEYVGKLEEENKIKILI